MKTIAIVLAAGSGSRMGSHKKKQFLMFRDKPLMCYCIETLERSPVINHIIVVTAEDDLSFVRDKLLGRGDYKKIRLVTKGGAQRCLSVLEGLKAADSILGPLEGETYVFIHDAARPFLTEDILQRNLEAVLRSGGCVTGMPSRDTVRLSAKGGDTSVSLAGESIPRDEVWLMQTPQTFKWDVAYPAFCRLEGQDAAKLKAITDDVMVVQSYDPGTEIELVEGAPTNIKITTKADLYLAEGAYEAVFGQRLNG